MNKISFQCIKKICNYLPNETPFKKLSVNGYSEMERFSSHSNSCKQADLKDGNQERYSRNSSNKVLRTLFAASLVGILTILD